MKYLTPLLLILFLPTILSAQKTYDPIVAFASVPADDTLFWYAGIPVTVYFSASAGAPITSPSGRLSRWIEGGRRANDTLELDPHTLPTQNEDEIHYVDVCVGAGKRRFCDRLYINIQKPELVFPPSATEWQGCRARVGELYNPSTDWKLKEFPESWCQTRVWIGENLVFDRMGTHFPNLGYDADRMRVTEGAKIRTLVYFRPYSTIDELRWQVLLSTDPSISALVHPCSGVEVVK